MSTSTTPTVIWTVQRVSEGTAVVSAAVPAEHCTATVTM